MPASPKPFVVLHHTLPDGQHWDLCLDLGSVLATWQLLENPGVLMVPGGALCIPARRIQDHRRTYLDYEGPVSGNRGQVARIDRGLYTLVDQQPCRWLIQLAGILLIGTYEITAAGDPGEMWSFQRVG